MHHWCTSAWKLPQTPDLKTLVYCKIQRDLPGDSFLIFPLSHKSFTVKHMPPLFFLLEFSVLLDRYIEIVTWLNVIGQVSMKQKTLQFLIFHWKLIRAPRLSSLLSVYYNAWTLESRRWSVWPRLQLVFNPSTLPSMFTFENLHWPGSTVDERSVWRVVNWPFLCLNEWLQVICYCPVVFAKVQLKSVK